ncbi:MAG TPA: YihY/virulence factor BrkB family protein [Polyangiaceae bacterium]|nr:YihY/virulence factor BrkB family protein [Polyangiaceae bacterium]
MKRLQAKRRWFSTGVDDFRWARRGYALFDETFDEYTKDRGDLAAAGLAFYTLLSMAPLIIIAVAIAGAVLGQGAAQHEALRLVRSSMGETAANTVLEWVRQASESGGLASIVGFLLVLYTASRLGAQLRVALNQVWNVDEHLAEGFKATVSHYLKRRLFAFVLVLASGPALLVVFASRAALSGLYNVLFAATPVAGVLAQLSQIVFSLIVVAAISAVVFKYVPDTRIGWLAVSRGGLLTSLLFNTGNWLVGLYLGRATVTQAYGAAGSAVVVLLWLYFSAQMFLFGAEFTQVYARHHGRGLSSSEANELSRVEERARHE